ncbi:amino acid transporter [Spinactinospora alkalitolerans]|uniref:Amino acid transporter n=1 Tax=Spinactinospora alkalitolerans TaxID=687207 RepID=A0A852U2D2_9ACTN|nr:APC family permease [Spinactinospora alkalitolerans]NYE50281.1 amino acid transporter [Spinactinospora alkalitolerans]
MEHPPTSAADRRPSPAQGDGLGRGAIGTGDLVFFVVAAAAPLTVMAGVAPLAISIGGVAAPSGYLLAGVLLLLFAVGFTAMSRHIRNAGAFYAYVGRGLGRRAGTGAALVALVSYNLIEIGLLAAFAFFTSQTLDSLFGVAIPWQVWALVGLTAIGLLGYLKVTLSAKVLGVALALEVAILLVFEVALIAGGGGPGGFDLASFDPANLATSGAGAMFVLTVGAFIGFEATAIYAEEARDPERSVPRATYLAVAFLGLFYAFTVWTFVVAYGSDRVQAVASGEGGADMVFAAAASFAGPWASGTMRVLIVVSAFAATLAFHNAANRYLFALGREGVLPSALARVDRRTRSPVAAVLTQSAFALVVLVAGMLLGADPYNDLLLLTNGPGILGIMALQALAAVSVIAFFRRDRRGFSAWRIAVAPAVAAAGLGVLCVLVAVNFELLTARGASVNAVLIATPPACFAAGWAVAARMRRTDPRRYARLTTVDAEEN